MKKISICASLFILVSCAYEPADELTIYTSRQPQLIEPIVEKFSLETGIKVNFLSGNAQELMERIDVEGDSSPADIFMTVDAGVLWQAAERDIFSSTNSKILDENIKDLHTIAKGLLEYETLTGEEIQNLIKGIKPKRDDDLSSDSSDDNTDNKKETQSKGPLPSFTKDQNFPLPN